MSNQEEQYLSSTPVDVAIKALQRQVDQLKQIINPSELTTQDNDSEELREQIKALQTANAKAEYRIKMLLRSLEEKDKQCQQ